MFRRQFWGFLLLLLPVLVLAEGFDVTSWAFEKKIIPSVNLVQDGFLEVSLDDEVMVNSRPDLADIRIIRDDDVETPYLGQLDVPVRIIDQSYLGDQATLITFDLGRSGIRHFGLTLTTGSDDTSRELQIESSDDNEIWTKLESVATGNTINYPVVTTRYLRVTIFDRGEKRLIVSGALAHRPVMLFRYELAHTYKLYFGESKASQPKYDLTALEAVSGNRHWLGSLGPKEDNPLHPEPPLPPPPRTIKSIYLLIGLGMLTAGVIGGFAYRLFKQTQV